MGTLFVGPARALPLQEIIARSEPAVVHVEVLSARGAILGVGSGFVVSSDGRFVTNHHVVADADRVEVTFRGGKKVEVEGVLDFDEASDLAVLKLHAGTYPNLALAGEPAKQGDSVVVMGSPMGFSGSVSTGIVAAVRPEGATLGGQRMPSWTPGSSGSPVMNEEAEVVAVAVGVVAGAGGHALSFGVPAAPLAKILAAGKQEPRPFHVLRGKRSPFENVVIFLGALGGIAVVVWLYGWRARRKRQRERDRGREVLGSILKP
jgi:S1-C subfamily serine protease